MSSRGTFRSLDPTRAIASVGLAALAALALGCAEGPTEAALQPLDPQFAPPGACSPWPSCKDDGGDDGGGDDGGGTSDQVNLAITLDDAGPAITSDGGGAYVEGSDGVEAHFSSANGNLMFRTEAGPRRVRVAVAGYDELIPVHRGYTNQNRNFTDGTLGTDVDLRTIDPGDDVSAAFYLEWNDPDTGEYFELRYGALCTEDKFDGDPTNDSHRVQAAAFDDNADGVTDWWTISSPPTGGDAPKAGAVLCKGTKVGRSGKVTMSHVADVGSAEAAFHMTLVREP